MKSIREKFEEIWPVPEFLYWDDKHDGYMLHAYSEKDLLWYEWNDRLDTFTRCQETTDVYVSLISELVESIERAEILICNIDAPTTGDGYSELMDWTEFETTPILDRAKQLLEQSK